MVMVVANGCGLVDEPVKKRALLVLKEYTTMPPLPLDVFVYLVMDPFLVALALYDRKTLGRVHPATITCIAILLPIQISSAWIARSAWWNTIAPWLVGVQ